MSLLTLLLLCSVVMAEGRLRLHLITYNVAGGPPREGLVSLLDIENTPDLVSLGCEELGDTSAWEDEMDEVLRTKSYYRVQKVTLNQIQIVIYALKKHLPFLTHVETEYTKTGFGGTWGNKGGVTVRFRLYDKTVAIVNSHLSAHMDQKQIRDEEYWNIMAEQDFDDPYAEHLYDHDYLFWTGDLNYRLEGPSNTQVKAIIAAGEHDKLLMYDQLLEEQQTGHAFIGFHEGPITFPPSYKFDPDTDVYDSSEKQRVPAWCDRVLWRIKAERQAIVRALNWHSDGHSDSLLSDVSVRDEKKAECEGDVEVDASPNTFVKLRKKTVSLMKKTAHYAGSSGTALLRTAVGSQPIKIHRSDIACADKFKHVLNTLQRQKLSDVELQYAKAVELVQYVSYPQYKASDHKPVAATLLVKFNTAQSPMLKFTRPSYEWQLGGKLELSIYCSNKTLMSSWDWVGLYDANWTEAEKTYLTFQWAGKEHVIFPGSALPATGTKYNVVYFSSQLNAPIAIAEVIPVHKQ